MPFFKNRYKPGAILLLFALFTGIVASAHEATGEKNAVFIENKNQWQKEVLFKADIPDGSLFLEKTGFTYNFYNGDDMSALSGHSFNDKREMPDKIRFHGLKVKFQNANQYPEIKKEGRSAKYYNYFLGNDKSKWASYCYAYSAIRYKEIYPAVDLSIYTSGHLLKYDFHVKPGADPSVIELVYEGADKIYLEDGSLRIKTSVNEITEQKPYAYQVIEGRKKDIPCSFILSKNKVSFKLPQGYDKTKELVIDPVLVFSRSSGSTADNFGMTATYDNEGHLYAGGMAYNNGYPTTAGAYDVTFAGPYSPARNTDVVITKYSPDGRDSIYSTYLGGTGTETVHSLIVDKQDELYLFGVTSSNNFPMINSYDNSFNGGFYKFIANNGTEFSIGTDIYIAKFNASGSDLLSSTYIGGTGNDGINHNNDSVYYNSSAGYQHPYDSLQFNYGDQFRGEIMLDTNGDCYIASCTRSADFPVVNEFQNTLKGTQDGVVCKFSPDLSMLLWSTYLGGNDKDAAYAVKVDTALAVYITGGTTSADFPVTTDVLDAVYKGGKADGFISKFDNSGNLLASTFIGTAAYDQSFFLELDRHRNIYIVGQSLGSYPITPAGIYNNSNSGQFITKIRSDLDSIFYSTVFGNGNGKVNISPAAFLVDRCENVYVSGWGADILQSTDKLQNMPVTSDAFQSTTTGFDFYLVAFTRNIDSLIYGTYFGGNTSKEHVDGGTSRFDAEGIIYQSVCAGCGGNDDFPNTISDAPLNSSTNCNNGIFKFDFEITPKVEFEPSVYSGCAPLTVKFNNFSKNIIYYKWDFGNNDTTSLVFEPERTFTDTGTYVVKLIVTDSICNVNDTALQTITVFQPVTLVPLKDTVVCDTATLELTGFTGATADTFIWSTNNQFTDTINGSLTDSVLTAFTDKDTIFYLKATNPDCFATDSIVIKIRDINILTRDTIVCTGSPIMIEAVNLDVNDTLTYTWVPESSIMSSLDSAFVFINPDSSKYYYLDIHNGFGCTKRDSISATVHPAINITHIPDTVLCDSAFVNLYSTTNGAAVAYQWSSFADFSNTLNNPLSDSSVLVHINKDSLFYIRAFNPGCLDTDSVTVLLRDINITLTNDTSICLDDTLKIKITNLDAADLLTHAWQSSSSILNTLNTDSLLVNPQLTETFAVTTTNGFGCSREDSITINVSNSSLSLITSNDTVFCKPDSINLFSSTFGKSTSYVWSADSLFSDTLNLYPDSILKTFIASDTTFYIISNITGCYRKDSVTIGLRDLKVNADDIFICKNTNGKLTAIATYPSQTLTWQWQPADSIILGQNTSEIIVSPWQALQYKVKVTDPYSCEDSALALVSVSDLTAEEVSLTADKDSIQKGGQVQLTALPAQGFNYLWLPSESLSDPLISNPVATPQVTTTYMVTVTDNEICSYNDTVTVYVYEVKCEEPYIFVPNAFTPNGDNENDILYVRGKYLTDLYFTVYNRWGEKVFETTDQAKGWDGYYKDMKTDPGVFVYHLKAKCLDGQEFFKKGNVTLIR